MESLIMRPAALAFFVVLVATTVSGATSRSLLAQLAFRTQASSSFLLRTRPNQDSVSKTLAALDADRDGFVGPGEVKAFATMQGLDEASATREFATLDANGDGRLDPLELSNALGVDMQAPVAAAAPEQAPVAAPAIAASQPVLPALVNPGEVPAAVSAQQAATAAASQSRLAEALAVVPAQQAATAAASQSQLAEAPAVVPAQQAATAAASQSQLAEAPAAVSAQQAAATAVSQSRLDAQSDAIAQLAATRIAEELAHETSDEEQAEALDHQAAELRSNSTTLARLAVQRAMSAASLAANRTAAEIMRSVLKIEDKMKRAEMEAAGLRARATAELGQAGEFMSVAGVGLREEPHSTI